MNFSFTEEQRLLEDTIRRFVARDYTFEKRRQIVTSNGGWSRDVWNGLAELGVLALNVPEEHGGLNASPVETLLVMEGLGTGLVVEPYLSSAVFATWLLRLTADASQQADFLPGLATGESIAAVAHAEPDARYELARVSTRATRDRDGYRLNGHKSNVLHGGAADLLLVSARTGGDVDTENGVSLFLVPSKSTGVTIKDYPTLDGRREAEVLLKDVSVPASACLGAEGSAFEAIERAHDIAIAAVCAEAIGTMKATLDATVEYLRTRKQFGQPIGRFQALQHRAADMLMHYEQSKSMAYFAAIKCNDEDRQERRRVVSAAKVLTGRACRFIGQQAVQLHGGMGMTDELNISHFFRRLTAIDLSFGDADSHIERFVGTMQSTV